MGVPGEQELIAVPAWRMGLSVAGRSLEYCVDAYFVERVSEAFRRILLVYPASLCTAVPSPGARLVRAEHPPVERVLDLLREGCGEAWRVSSRPRRSGLLRFVLSPSPEDLARMEARTARELCTTVFGDLEHGYSVASLASGSRSYIEYRVGDRRSQAWRRLQGLARIDRGVAEALTRLLSGDA